MTNQVTLAFDGPFSWSSTSDAMSLFDTELRRHPGIYLWTVPQEGGHLVYYVGETGRSFQVRLLEHYLEHAACMYHIYAPVEFGRGQKVLLWPGRYDSEIHKSPGECIAEYSRLHEPVSELTNLYRFMLAPLSCENRVRRRVEAAIAGTLYNAPGVVGTFQDRGIRYDPRKAEEEPIECIIISPVPILGLPSHLVA